jgi:O-antigen polymerase
MVELPFYISQLHWLFFIALIALVASHRSRSRAINFSQMARTTLLAGSVSLPVLASIFFSHSLISSRIILYYTFSPNKDLSMLNYPMKNIYYRQGAEFLRMQTLLKYALTERKPEILREYIRWADQLLEQIPEVAVFMGKTYALHSLGEYQQSYQVLRKGLSIYPTTPQMLDAKAAIQNFDRQLGRPVGVP